MIEKNLLKKNII